MKALLAIDPGTEESGWCVLEEGRVSNSDVSSNSDVLALVKLWDGDIAMERIAGMGMSVGQSTFDTCVWIGRFVQAYRNPDAVRLVFRRDVKLHICGVPQAKDKNIRQALIDMFPPLGGGKVPQIGTKKLPGPLYGVSSHVWSALAVGITALNTPDVRRKK